MKTLRIKDHKKFNRFLAILSVTAIIAIFLLVNFMTASPVFGGRETPFVIVKNGDSIWKIAENLDSGLDTREVVYDIMTMNGLKDARIYPGQVLYYPIYD